MQLPTNVSLASYLASQPSQIREQVIRSLSDSEAEALQYDWRFWARAEQLEPGTPGADIQRDDWLLWVIQSGRGFGKTRTHAETIREWAEDPAERIMLVGATANDVREVMMEGPSGLLNCYPPDRRPLYNSSRHLITFPSGAVGMTKSADEPNRIRGFQFTKFWADELCAWRFLEDSWEQIMYGFRLPHTRIRGLISTTPKPVKTFKEIIADESTVVTRGSSFSNRDNLSDVFYAKVIAPRVGTRLGKQEIFGELLDDVPGALWTQQRIDAARIMLKDVQWDKIIRIVVAIDPAVTSNADSDETGIVVVGLTISGHLIVLDDLSCKESPLGWASIAVTAYRSKRADRIVGEVNNGGDLVESNIRAVAPDVAFRAVRASRGKAVRAEPVAALYEQGRVHHVGFFAELEQQMTGWSPQSGERSPDRMDALVWAVTELVVDPEDQMVSHQFAQPVVISPI